MESRGKKQIRRVESRKGKNTKGKHTTPGISNFLVDMVVCNSHKSEAQLISEGNKGRCNDSAAVVELA